MDTLPLSPQAQRFHDQLRTMADQFENIEFAQDDRWVRSMAEIADVFAEFSEAYGVGFWDKLTLEIADPFTPGLSSDTLYQYAGPLAQTADMDRLFSASRMQIDGEAPELIRQETGWFRGMDGQWRFEICDLEIELQRIERNTVSLLGEILSHPALFEAYPHLADVHVAVHISGETPPSGVYRSKAPVTDEFVGQDEEIEIRASRSSGQEEILKILLHEIQHAIQEFEGFARGGVFSLDEEESEELQLFDDALLLHVIMQGEGEGSVMDIFKAEQRRPPHEHALLYAIKYPPEVLDVGLARCRREFDEYQSLPGEVEARDAASRFGLSDIGRFIHPPQLNRWQAVDDSGVRRPLPYKGRISFLDDGAAVINLFENADVSTVVHEMGHLLRRRLEVIAEDSDDETLKEAWQDVETWAGVWPGESWNQDQEEAFAEAFERYLLYGESPNQNLKNAFQVLSAWLEKLCQRLFISMPEPPPSVKRVLDLALSGKDDTELIEDERFDLDLGML